MKLCFSQVALLNRIIPGKRRAALLLVANERTRAALPHGVCTRVEGFGENGVELDLWALKPRGPHSPASTVTFAFVGRLVALKGVDLLIEAFAVAVASASTARMRLVIVGDGEERENLQRQAAALFPSRPGDEAELRVRFTAG